jgi:hypothetical protein
MIKRLTAVSSLWLVFTIETFAQGICIPAPLKVTTLKGQVVTSLTKGEEPLPNASVELRQAIYQGRVIKKVKANENGEFSFQDIKVGNYVLTVTYPQLARIDIPILLGRVKGKENLDQMIVIVLGSNFTKPCGGGRAFIHK